MKILRIDPSHPQKEFLKEAISFLKEGKIVAFPTDTVYGIGVDGKNEEAVKRLYERKKRPREKPLILFLSHSEELPYLIERIPLPALRLANHFWPGPLTLVFYASPVIPPPLVSREGKTGVRVPAHSIPRSLVKESGCFLSTTSANLSGTEAPLKAEEVKERAFWVDLLIDGGDSFLGEESTVIDVTGSIPRILREGWLKKGKIQEIWEKKGDILFVCSGNTCRSVMAEGIFRVLWEEKGGGRIKIHSAGTSTFYRGKPSPFALEILRERAGIDLSSHLTTPLSQKMVEEADLILVMEKRHQEKIHSLYPFSRGKVFLLPEFASPFSGEEREVQDPVGGTREDYQRVAENLKKWLEKIVERIRVRD